VHWKSWADFATAAGEDPTAVNNTLLASWLAGLVQERQSSEGTISKSRVVVTSTWSLIHDPASLCDKMAQAAAKVNKPRGKSISAVWDLSYAHEYLFEQPCMDKDEASDFSRLIENTIIKIRVQSGWRSADLVGLLQTYSFTWLDHHTSQVTHGVQVRLWNTKTAKNKWSPPVFFPRLATKYANLCAYRALKKLSTALLHKNIADVEVISPSDPSKKIKAKPLLVFQPPKAKRKDPDALFKPLKEATIANYFTKAFLANVRDNDKPFSDEYKPHSARHAVASKLSACDVSPILISELTLNSAATLSSTYIVPVKTEWKIPKACVATQLLLPAKLLLPFVHYHSTAGDDSKPCDCANILEQVPPPSA
jgi:hypothetical protein